MHRELLCLVVCAASATAQNLTITTQSLPRGVQYEPYSATLAAAGGTAPYTWSLNHPTSPALSGLDGLVLDAATGRISGTPTKGTCCSVSVNVTDARGAQATRNAFLSIAPNLRVGVPANGLNTPGRAQDSCDVLSGVLPPGVTWGPAPPSACALAGTPAKVGAYAATLGLSGAVVADEVFQVRMGAAIPSAGTVGSPYDQAVAVEGGEPPYQFSVAAGALPAGLSLDSSSGRISGTPSKYEYAAFKLKITDNAGNVSLVPLGLSVELPVLETSDISIDFPASAAAGQTVPVTVSLKKPLPLDLLSGVLLQFYPDPTINVGDPTVQLSGGLQLPAGQRYAVFGLPPNGSTAPSLTLNTGTTAGDIVITTRIVATARELTPSPAPYRVVHIPRAEPVIQKLTAAGNGNGITLTVAAFSTTRDLTQAAVSLTAAPGVTLAKDKITFALSSIAVQWFASSESIQYGSQFGLVLPITLEGGAKDVTSVSVTLTNSIGTSNAATAQVTQ